MSLFSSNPMLIVGVTGGIATGKSQATRLFASFGAVVFSADEASRAILTPHGSVVRAIGEAFGADCLTPEGTLHRKRVAEIVFTDPRARELLNRITHPPILRLLYAQIESTYYEISPHALVVVEVPLLYESHLQDWFDRVVVIASSEATQIARLTQTVGLSEFEARQRIATQMPLEQKRVRADIVVENESNLANLAGSVEQVAQHLWTQARNRKISPRLFRIG